MTCAIAGTAWADQAINPFQAPPRGIYSPPYPTEFQDYSQLFARIVADRGLKNGFLYRLTVGLRKVESDWRIAHEHHSVPVTD
jgi:hypothetical protein